MKRKITRLLTAFILVLMLSQACFSQNSCSLYDFEQPWQYEEWQTADKETQKCFASNKYTADGDWSIGFVTKSSDLKPKLEVLVWDNGWDIFDYYSMVITNPTSQRIPLTCTIANENGASSFITLDAMSSKTYVIKTKFPKFARKDNILTMKLEALAIMDAEFYIDKIELYKEGHEPKVKDEKRKKDVTTYTFEKIANKLDEQLIEQLKENCSNIGKYFDSLGLDMPQARKSITDRANSIVNKIKDESLSRKDKALLLLESEQLKMASDRFIQINDIINKSQKSVRDGYITGFADSMVKVMPKDVKLDIDTKQEAVIELAGNEKEAKQLVIVPFAKNLKGVKVHASDLKGDNGNIIPAVQINCDLMGFVKTTGISDDYPRYIGWYPEPIIQNPEKIDIEIGDAQSWWIRVRTKENQAAGKYTGKLTVTSDNSKTVEIGISVRVFDFNMPKTAPIPTSITYDAQKHPTIGDEARWDKKLKYIHADFLADYMLNIDSMYRNKNLKIDWDLMKYCDSKGQLSAINLGYFYDSKDESIADFKYNYDKAKELGLLKYCYIYGFDEQPRHTYEWINEAAKKFKEAYPEVLVLTTAQDHSYGFDGEMEDLTGWCPIINRYNPTLAEEARKKGRRVWWYTCNWPKAPYPNIYVDYPAIDLRVLMGLMHAKYKPDGFLYYHTSIYSKKNEGGISTYPWTDWEPWNFVSTNGDGALFCINSEGYPVATIRVENYRDGLEDLAYYMILENQVKIYEDGNSTADNKWLTKAKELLASHNKYVRARYDFTHNPDDIREYRKQLAESIEQSPIKDTNPWKNGISIWGL